MVRGAIVESQNIFARIVLRYLDRKFNSGLGDSCWLLHGLVRALKPATVVEIGSARGKSACYMALALRENGRGMLHAIDPHTSTDWNDTKAVDSYTWMTRTIRTLGLERWITVVRKTSNAAASGWSTPIDLLFIDGDHSYDGVKRDFDLFSPHLSERGVCLFHDTAWNVREDLAGLARTDMGVPKFVDELRASGFPVITLPENYGVSIVQRRKGGLPLIVR
jgi:predicted O-methyltransferase YrrM